MGDTNFICLHQLSPNYLTDNWLPDMGSNHDWVSQSHLCYHYTIGQ